MNYTKSGRRQVKEAFSELGAMINGSDNFLYKHQREEIKGLMDNVLKSIDKRIARKPAPKQYATAEEYFNTRIKSA